MKIQGGIEVIVSKIEPGETSGTDKVGKEINPGIDGFLGQDLRKLHISLRFARDKEIIACSMSGTGDLFPLRDKNQGQGDEVISEFKVDLREMDPPPKEAARAMEIEPPSHKFMGVSIPSNQVKIFLLEKGVVSIIEVAVVSQFGHLYLTVQETTRLDIGLWQGKVSFRKHFGVDIDQWSQFSKFMNELVEKGIFRVKKFRKEPRTKEKDLRVRKGHGVVLWYNQARGFGLILNRMANILGVNWRYIKTKPGRRALLERGQFVKIGKTEIVKSNDGPHLEARGVRLI